MDQITELYYYDIYNVNNQYWNQQFSVEEGTEFKGLTAIWAEIQIGIKAELFNNFFGIFEVK